MFEKCPKCHISCNSGQFWDHMTHSKAPYTTQQSTLNGSYSPKSLYKLVLPENGYISTFFWSANVPKMPKMSYFMQFWPILGSYDPLKGPLHYQQSTLNDSYFSKILHKLERPENWYISIFFEVEMFEKCLKCHI